MSSRAAIAQVMYVAIAIPAAVVCTAAVATDYMTASEAMSRMFPAATGFAAQAVTVTPEQARRIAARAGTTFNTAAWQLYEARAAQKLLGYVVVDAVTGKFELINYAVALEPDGTIRAVEILSYREAHGSEVRTRAWRNQFVGKSASAPLALNDDIANISGATLSCSHLTDGIRRIAAYVQTALARS
jgi:Na+-translocating ferredoxin:NAD+ oxidoreductase RnfG subunit